MGKKKGKGRGNHDLDTMSEVSSVMSVSSYNTNRSDDEFDEHFVDDEGKFKSFIDDVQRELIAALSGAGKGIAATLAIVTGSSFDPNDVLETTKTFRNIFKLGFAKGDGSIPELKASQVALIVEC